MRRLLLRMGLWVSGAPKGFEDRTADDGNAGFSDQSRPMLILLCHHVTRCENLLFKKPRRDHAD
jgi:hypothetical protein